MATGIVLTSASLPFMLIAAAISSQAASDCAHGKTTGNAADYEQWRSCQDARQSRGYAIVGTGIVMLGVGIPLIVYGAKKVPDGNATATLTPWMSPTAGGATFRLTL